MLRDRSHRRRSGIAISLPSNILILHETGQYSKT
jgi:hypothetical protein